MPVKTLPVRLSSRIHVYPAYRAKRCSIRIQRGSISLPPGPLAQTTTLVGQILLVLRNHLFNAILSVSAAVVVIVSSVGCDGRKDSDAVNAPIANPTPIPALPVRPPTQIVDSQTPPSHQDTRPAETDIDKAINGFAQFSQRFDDSFRRLYYQEAEQLKQKHAGDKDLTFVAEESLDDGHKIDVKKTDSLLNPVIGVVEIPYHGTTRLVAPAVFSASSIYRGQFIITFRPSGTTWTNVSVMSRQHEDVNSVEASGAGSSSPETRADDRESDRSQWDIVRQATLEAQKG